VTGRSIVPRASTFALALAVSGCALTLDSTRLGVPVNMAGGPRAASDSGIPFRVTKHPVYLIAGLLPVSQPNLEDVLAGQVGPAPGREPAYPGAEPVERPAGDGADAGAGVPRSVTFEGVVAK